MQGMASTLIKSLDLSELRVNLMLISQFLIAEIQHHDESLAMRLADVFQKLLNEA